MAMKFDREKLPNYALAGIVFIVAVLVARAVTMSYWRFDFFRLGHLRGFLKYALSGKIFLSGHYLSMLFVIPGMAMLAAAAVTEAYDRDLSKLSEYIRARIARWNEKEKTKEEKQAEAPKAAPKEVPKEPVKQAAEENQAAFLRPVRTQSPERYAAYDNRPAGQSAPAAISLDEEVEKERLQAKIKEVMERMKSKEAAAPVPEEAPASAPSRILSPAKFSTKKEAPARTAMNFKSVSAEDNTYIEHVMIDAGFKLLSEIRIGTTGIDYLGVAKDEISVMQVYTEPGNWMASEEQLAAEEARWFSEDNSRLSPVARAAEAKRDIERLISGKISLPVKTYACLASASVINSFDMGDEWARRGVSVLKLRPEGGADNIATLNEAFPANSKKEIDEPAMQELIKILEAAELPE